MTLSEKLEKIRSPRLQNQRNTAVVLHAVEDTLRVQKCDASPTAYFAALLAILGQSVSADDGILNKDLAVSVIYLLDLTTSEVPAPLLRAKFSQILTNLAPTLTQTDTEASLIKSSIGCLESLLLAQDAAAWALPQTQIGPRRAIAGLLSFAQDSRPKVRRRAQDAITRTLENPPPSPALDHPAADMCAETALASLSNIIAATAPKRRRGNATDEEDRYTPDLMHALQLVKTIALASRGWPSRKIEVLCKLLMDISRSSGEYLTMAAFEIFELIFENMTGVTSSAKLPQLLESIKELKPAQTDTQLISPWIAVIARGYDISAQVEPNETFSKLPDLIPMVAEFLTASSHSVRTSASECLISFLATCIPMSVILEPSIYDEKTFEKITKSIADLLHVKYQSAWMEVFKVVSALFEALKWRAIGITDGIVKNIGQLRSNVAFAGKKEADAVLGKAIAAVGPEAFLTILPLNLAKPTAEDAGRAWILPILRDHVTAASLAHFRMEFVPLSEAMYQRIIDHGEKEKTTEIKIFDTVIQQIWALLPGYCDLPVDLVEAFDQSFAELLSNLLYKQTQLRVSVCKALQNLVESNQQILATDHSDEELTFARRTSRAGAQKNVEHMSTFGGNLLAVLFNVYGQTLPQYRGYILLCINAYLSITPEKELQEVFLRVTSMLESSLPSPASSEGSKKKPSMPSSTAMPSQSHTLLDLLVTLSPYLPSSSLPNLFSGAAKILPLTSDPQLQKKAYKIIPKLATTEAGSVALKARSADLQHLLLENAASATMPSRHERINALGTVVMLLPPEDLHFIPSILSEIVIATKETNEKARLAAFSTLILMAEAMTKPGGTVAQAKIPHMAADAPTTSASLEEFFTMLAAGLGGGTPHMISASITAITRVLYDYYAQLPTALIEELVGTMTLFLENPNREIVGSVLGFMKVAIISLPVEIMQPKLVNLVPGLMRWSREHKSHFRVKVKGILERAMRRFGAEVIERACPEQDKNFVKNIRKTRERNKRKKKESAGGDREDLGSEDDGSDRGTAGKPSESRKARFNNAFDAEVYGSESDASSTMSVDHTTKNRSQATAKSKYRDAAREKERLGVKKRGTFIHETTGDDHDPLDLLSTSALGHISSSTSIARTNADASRKKHQGKVNIDGKLVIGMDDDDDGDEAPDTATKYPPSHGSGAKSRSRFPPTAMEIDSSHNDNGKSNISSSSSVGATTDGIDAYVAAIRGRDSVQRGRGGRLKFDNRKRRRDYDDEGDAMEIDHDDDGGGGGGGGAVRGGKPKHNERQKQKEGERVNGLRIHWVGSGAAGSGGNRGGRGGSGSGGNRGRSGTGGAKRGGAIRGGRVGKRRGGAFPGRRK